MHNEKMVEYQNTHIKQSELQKRIREKNSDIRGPYYRDTTAIIHSSAFRRLKHKTQVFFAPNNDHICTRIEHVLHVASIASTVCRGLSLDQELAWAIGMGHDLGHTPFGHVGEVILSDIMEKQGYSKFEHEIHSLRVVDFLSNKGQGMNLTYAVRDGIVCHCGESFIQCIKPTFMIKDLDTIKQKKDLIPTTYEGAIVRFCDSIAYLGRDWEDACRLKIIDKDSMPEGPKKLLGLDNSKIIDTLVTNLIESSDIEGIRFSNEIFEAVKEMKDYNYQNIYKSPILNEYKKYFSRLLNLIYEYLTDLFKSFYDNKQLYCKEKNMLAIGFGNHVSEMLPIYIEKEGNADRLIYDYIAGMSDNFALDCANEILIPEHLNERLESNITGKWFDF
ncbi:MAG: HD domain-containing protein [Spirochaetia bacterium]|nr:HD domain-containing protein [Spirochaetia bacterium]